MPKIEYLNEGVYDEPCTNCGLPQSFHKVSISKKYAEILKTKTNLSLCENCMQSLEFQFEKFVSDFDDVGVIDAFFEKE